MPQIMLAIVWLVTLAACAPPTQVDAQGRPAVVSDRWELRDDRTAIGIVLNLVRCDDAVFLSDVQGWIRLYDLNTTEQQWTQRADGIPFALAADCITDRLHVVELGQMAQVRTLNATTGEPTGELPLPETFLVRRSAYLLPDGQLFISGVQAPTRDAMTSRPADTWYEPFQLGLLLSLETGETTPLLPPYDRVCRGAGTCPDVDVVPSPHGWVAAQPTSTGIGLYRTAVDAPLVVDVQSPRFRRTGQVIPATSAASVSIGWRAENSTIARVFGFPEAVATIHTTPDLDADDEVFQLHDDVYYMNLHAYDGTPLVSDIRLPGRAVGRDDTAIYVIEGGMGSRAARHPAVTLVRIPVRVGTAGFTSG